MTLKVVSERICKDVEECEKSKEKLEQEGETLAAPPPAQLSTFVQIISSPTALLQMIWTSIAFFIYLFTASKEKIYNYYVITSEQEEILKQTPRMQKELQAEMDKASIDQKNIGRDIDNLKERLARLEERKRQRLEVMRALNHATLDS
mmetsp:Transcript_9924/g.18649  ORF Transcript_9924/g.18649 Transcript_9924/m.18649 type:complete len:148 (+) Transcript_9924:98-541(+)|eukprot:CAMPEP_0176488904 /NCGR_PEP_ID=MMETSP0200_2-20121128/6976_1 /TAXON_ID=947934 /ORGANISM="Chaetoceros sp., Strain GSL56" /LENGTH=147 /DNA_ID=CAMNT_0017885955 /DNA_START=76 /DNA_END=519 /DNA_ORIENTATION=+